MVDFLVILAVLSVYFTPSLFALWHHRSEVKKIFLINLALGWTIVGWLFAFTRALGIGTKRKRRYGYEYGGYGGTVVSTVDRFNMRFISACFGLIAAATLGTSGLHLIAMKHDTSPTLTDAEASIAASANSQDQMSSSQAPGQASQAKRSGNGAHPAERPVSSPSSAHHRGSHHVHSRAASKLYVDGIPKKKRRRH